MLNAHADAHVSCHLPLCSCTPSQPHVKLHPATFYKLLSPVRNLSALYYTLCRSGSWPYYTLQQAAGQLHAEQPCLQKRHQRLLRPIQELRSGPHHHHSFGSAWNFDCDVFGVRNVLLQQTTEPKGMSVDWLVWPYTTSSIQHSFMYGSVSTCCMGEHMP
jgi:hypothetical protein